MQRIRSLLFLLLLQTLLLPTRVHANVLFDIMSGVFQPAFKVCAKDKPCPDETFRCVRQICLRKDTERRDMLTSSRDVQRALFAASLATTAFQSPVPQQVSKQNTTCQTWDLMGSMDFEEGYRYVMYSGRRVDVLVFKGTTTKTEILDDLDFIKTPCTLADQCGQVHRGFNRVFQTMKSNLTTVLEQHTDKPLIIVGHSLGGAVATLAALYIAEKFPRRTRAVFLLGTPRVGDEQFKDVFQQKVASRVLVRRFFMTEGGMQGRWDPVTLIPKGKGYVHVVPALAIECETDQSQVCSTRELHSVFLYEKVLARMIDKRWWVLRKCGRI